MPETFGTRLRRQRERRQISLATIADQTKIHLPLLDELESDRVAHWPSGIFRRAFIRAYAEAIGLNSDEVVREFLSLYPDPSEIVTIGDTMASVPSQRLRPPTRIAEIADGVIEAVLRFLRRVVGRDDQPVAAPAEPVAARLPVRHELFDDEEIARVLGTAGMIAWAWDADVNALVPAMTAGYSERVLAQLPHVGRDADNATAAAFRLEQICSVPALEEMNGALAVPIVRDGVCTGVLAVELPGGTETSVAMRAAVTLLAQQIGRLVDFTRLSSADRYTRSVLRRA
jgi:GAF domain-containing protein